MYTFFEKNNNKKNAIAKTIKNAFFILHLLSSKEKRRKMERLIIALTIKKEKFIINLKTIINAKRNKQKIALTPIGAIFNFII